MTQREDDVLADSLTEPILAEIAEDGGTSEPLIVDEAATSDQTAIDDK